MQMILFTTLIIYMLYVWYKRILKLASTTKLLFENRDCHEEREIYAKVLWITIKAFIFDVLIAWGTLMLIPGGTIIGLSVMILINFITTAFYKQFNNKCSRDARREVEKELKYYKKSRN